MRANVKIGTTLLTDRHRSYPGLTDYRHDPRTVSKMAGHIIAALDPSVFALMKRWGSARMGCAAHRHLSQRVCLPVQSALLPARLVRNHARARLAPPPMSYWDIIGRDNPRKGVPTVRREPQRRRTATGMRADRSRPPEKSTQPRFRIRPPVDIDQPDDRMSLRVHAEAEDGVLRTNRFKAAVGLRK